MKVTIHPTWQWGIVFGIAFNRFDDCVFKRTLSILTIWFGPLSIAITHSDEEKRRFLEMMEQQQKVLEDYKKQYGNR